MSKHSNGLSFFHRAPSPLIWGRVLLLIGLAMTLVACGGGAFGTPTPIPASVVRPVQPSPVYSTAQPRFRLENATPEPIFVTPAAETANLSPITVLRAPAQPVMPQSPTAMGIATGGASLLDAPGGRVTATIPAGASVTVTGRSADGRWLAVFTNAGVAGWVSAGSLRLFGDDDLTIVERSFSMAPIATLLAEAMLPVASPMSAYLASLTATPEPPANAVAAVPGALPGVIISNSRLNVRAAPNIAGEIVAKVEPQATVTVVGKDAAGRWLQIELDEGAGWVAADFVRLQGDAGTLPTIEGQ